MQKVHLQVMFLMSLNAISQTFDSSTYSNFHFEGKLNLFCEADRVCTQSVVEITVLFFLSSLIPYI